MHSLQHVRGMLNAVRTIAHLCDGDPRDDERKRYSRCILITHIECPRVCSGALVDKRKSGWRCVVEKPARFDMILSLTTCKGRGHLDHRLENPWCCASREASRVPGLLPK
jgi:hypothetical protein